MVTRIPMSVAGQQKLREELGRLERKDRIEVMKAIEVGRSSLVVVAALDFQIVHFILCSHLIRQ